MNKSTDSVEFANATSNDMANMNKRIYFALLPIVFLSQLVTCEAPCESKSIVPTLNNGRDQIHLGVTALGNSFYNYV